MSVDAAGHVIVPPMVAARSPASALAPASMGPRAKLKKYPSTTLDSQKRRERPAFGAWMVVAPMVIVAVAVVAVRTRYAGAPATPAAPTNATIGAKARLVVVATPADAHIFVDDVVIGDNPAQLTFARDGVAHRIRVEAEGYVPKEETVVLDGASVNLELALDRAPSPTVSAKAPAPPTPSASSHPRGAPKALSGGNQRPVAGTKATAALNDAPLPAAASASKPIDPGPGKKLLDTGDPWTR